LLNPNCLVVRCKSSKGTFGNLGKNTLIGPGLFELDYSMKKQFDINERVNLQFRAEFFNILNHPNFGKT
jgi:hypothetical protein